jgi:hypothetical protein
MKDKVSIYIDGYNLYHHIKNQFPQKPYLKWLNLKTIFYEFAKKEEFEIIKVKFFTAPPIHRSKDTIARYQNYIAILKYYGVEIIEGQFKKKNINFITDNGQKLTKTTYEEKESDVNLSLTILYQIQSLHILYISNIAYTFDNFWI